MKIRMKGQARGTTGLLVQIFMVMVIYSSLRLLFLVYNFSTYQSYSWGQWAECFLLGLRFDLSTVFMLSAPFVLLGFLPQTWFRRRTIQWSHRVLFVLVHAIFIFANLADMEYYGFTGTRLTLRILNLQQDVANQSGQIIFRFWYLILIGFVFCYWLLRYPRIRSSYSIISYRRHYLNQFFLLVFTVVAIRGGLQTKVLKPVHAFQGGSPELGVLALNSTFTILKSKLKNEISEVKYFADKAQVQSWLGVDKNRKPFSPFRDRQNVVILILESFATEFWGVANQGKGYTPFLDSLAKRPGSLFFKNNFANGRRSMDALPAILFGLPNLMNTALAKSEFYSNEWRGLGTLLAKHGYSTSFFHGAPRGSMYFDAVAKLAGVQNYYGMEDYSRIKKDHDGFWGIFDEPFLQYMVENLNQQKPPFLSVAFTLTSHNPYPIPDSLKAQFPEGTLPIHPAIGYTDFSLKQFFQMASKNSWYRDTLFIITGDHTERSDTKKYMNSVGRYRVPLLVYHPAYDDPEVNWPKVNLSRVTQHADILPTALHVLGYEKDIPNHFGHSVFAGVPGKALLYSDQNYWWVEEGQFAHLVPNGKVALYDFVVDPGEKSPLPISSDKKLRWKNKIRSHIQYFHNGLTRNELYSY